MKRRASLAIVGNSEAHCRHQRWCVGQSLRSAAWAKSAGNGGKINNFLVIFPSFGPSDSTAVRTCPTQPSEESAEADRRPQAGKRDTDNFHPAPVATSPPPPRRPGPDPGPPAAAAFDPRPLGRRGRGRPGTDPRKGPLRRQPTAETPAPCAAPQKHSLHRSGHGPTSGPAIPPCPKTPVCPCFWKFSSSPP